MPNFGDIAVPETLTHERHFQTDINYTLGPNQVGVWGLLSYSMPMAGSLASTIFVGLQIQGNIQDIDVTTYQNSTPAPSGDFGASVNGAGGTDSYLIAKDIAFWSSLAAGTVVTVNMRVATGPYSVNVLVITANGFLRSMRQ